MINLRSYFFLDLRYFFGKNLTIGLFSIERQVPLNDFSGAIFKNLDVDNQMSRCGQDEPLSWPKNAFFSCVIGIYFVAFFIDHPVSLLVICTGGKTEKGAMGDNDSHIHEQYSDTNR